MPARPVLGSRKQSLAYSLLTITFRHEPALQETYRLPRVATIGMRTQVNFEKPDQFAGRNLRNEDRQRHRSIALFLDHSFQCAGVFFRRRIRPQRFAQLRQLFAIRSHGKPDLDFVHSAFTPLRL